MPLTFEFVPPRVNGVALLHAAKAAAEIAAAHVILAAAEPLVPFETGEMRGSGKVEHDELGATVSFSREGPDGYNVAARQHEDESLNHPNGGQAHFLSAPMQTEQRAVLAALAATVRARLG